MVEPLLYAALGFLTASLVALFMGRALWNRAVRLTTHRIMRRLPLSRDEIVASRDLLRAEQAIEHRRLERQANLMRSRMTQSMADVGRRDAANFALRTAVNEANTKAASAETREAAALKAVEKLKAEAKALKAQVAQLEGGLSEEQQNAKQRARERAELVKLADNRRAEVSAAKEEIAKAKAATRALENELAASRKELAEAQARLEQSNEVFRNESERAAAAEQRLAAAAGQSDPSSDEISALRQQIEWLALDIARVAGSNGRLLPSSAPRDADPIGVEN